MIEALKNGLPNMKFLIVRESLYHEYLRQWNQPVPPRVRYHLVPTTELMERFVLKEELSARNGIA